MGSKVYQSAETGLKMLPDFALSIVNKPSWFKIDVNTQSFSINNEPSIELPTDLGCKNLAG